MTACTKQVSVWVPATSANLGPGFDTLGLALSLGNRFTFEPAEELSFEGCEERFANEDHLAYATFRDTLAQLGVEAGPVRLTCDTPVPLSGGLGSSSTCIVAGIMAAMAWAGVDTDASRVLELACEREGHPDNVAPAVLGGLVTSFTGEGGEVYSTATAVSPAWRFVTICPPYEVRTEDARRALPETVPLEDAVWQLGRCGAMVRALETGDAALLGAACDDRLHEPYRRSLIPDYAAVREACLGAGASAFWISGSGSTMMAACLGDEVAAEVAVAARDAQTFAPLEVMVLTGSVSGAHYLP